MCKELATVSLIEHAKRLELKSLRADLGAVEGLLNGRTKEDDPFGVMQFSQRRAYLMSKLADIDAKTQSDLQATNTTPI